MVRLAQGHAASLPGLDAIGILSRLATVTFAQRVVNQAVQGVQGVQGPLWLVVPNTLN